MPFYAQHIKSARLHLQKNDPVFKRLLKSVGPFTAKTRRDRFGTLVSSIISQQISVAAARTIRGRLIDAVAPEKISPESLLKFDVDSLRAVGVSRQKATYVLDLAEKVDAGTLDLASIHRRDDEAVIQEMVQVKGVGRWTAQMFLMFSLGRLDVLPVDDLGLKNAIAKHYELDDLPDKHQMEALAENWRPYSTIACWYLWQSLKANTVQST
jgi:DNA-3-methyladenine glycosylase II